MFHWIMFEEDKFCDGYGTEGAVVQLLNMAITEI